MREILFRGKRSDNGEWSEGSLLYDSEQNESYIAECFEDKAAYLREVVPETVGQFTGLIDKNGKKIFEDDIIKVTDDNGETNLCSCGIGDVCFCYGVWYIEGEVNDGLYDVKNIYYIEIIGNIHDNPELLKGGEAE